MLSDLYIRLRSLFRRTSVDQELDDELRFHLEQQVEKYQRAGLPPAEARRKASLEFGGLEQVREDCREARGVMLLETLAQDLRYGLRMLGKSPGFTAVVVLTLGLGIGANTAIFSVVNAVMLESLPVRDPHQLALLHWSAQNPPENTGTSSHGDCDAQVTNGCSFSLPMFERIHDRKDLFNGVTAFSDTRAMNVTGNGPATMAAGQVVSGDYFSVLGVGAFLGRTLQPADDQPSAPPVMVLHYAYWQKMFGGAPNVLGKVVRLNNVAFTIVGVADPTFTRLTPGKTIDMWVPLSQTQSLGVRREGDLDASSWWLVVLARLRPDVSQPQAQSALNVLFLNETMHGAKPAWTKKDNPNLVLSPAQTGLTGVRNWFGKPLLLLMGAVGIVLLIACANVAGLILARGNSRLSEMAVRLALGAGRSRIIRQLLTECLLLSFFGTALGSLLAYAGTQSLAAFFAENDSASLQMDLRPTLSVLFFTIGVTLFTAIGFGLLPALRGARANVSADLKANSRTNTIGRIATGRGLVILQVALSVVVLVGAGLLVRTIDKLRSINPGFDTRNLLLFSIEPSLAGYKRDQSLALYQNLQRRLAAIPGVLSVSYASDALLAGGYSSQDLHVEGQADNKTVECQMLEVGPAYFTTMKIPLLAGRGLQQADMDPNRRAAVVNRSFVRQFVGDRNPLGLHFSGGGKNDPQWEIVGVVGDTKYARPRDPKKPIAFTPLRDEGATFALRTIAAPASVVPAARKVVNEAEINLPVTDIRTQTEASDRLLLTQRLLARLFGLFGVLGSVLACIGLYGLLSYEVARRTRELGIRTALGAQRRDMLLLVLRQGLALVIVGALVGVGAAVAVTRLLENLLFDVRPSDPVTLVAVAVLLISVGAVACMLPARRAAQVDPMVALRYE